MITGHPARPPTVPSSAKQPSTTPASTDAGTRTPTGGVDEGEGTRACASLAMGVGGGCLVLCDRLMRK